jgi:hypothetical protein
MEQQEAPLHPTHLHSKEAHMTALSSISTIVRGTFTGVPASGPAGTFTGTPSTGVTGTFTGVPASGEGSFTGSTEGPKGARVGAAALR